MLSALILLALWLELNAAFVAMRLYCHRQTDLAAAPDLVRYDRLPNQTTASVTLAELACRTGSHLNT
jgi:hypothetical protein